MASTLKLLHDGFLSISPATAWYLADLGEFRSKQELPTYPNFVASFSACKCV